MAESNFLGLVFPFIMCILLYWQLRSFYTKSATAITTRVNTQFLTLDFDNKEDFADAHVVL